MNKKVIAFIKSEYGVSAEYLWADTPNFAVFRNNKNKKWFCVLMEELPKSKFGLDSEERVDVINLKCDPMFKYTVIDNVGVFPAYHMNKEHWISVFLDGSVNLKDIKMLVDISYNLVNKK